MSKPLYRQTNLQIIFGVTLMAVMGVSSITPAFPKIIDRFNLTGPQVGLLITAFTLPGVFLTPVAGVIADRLGRKRILVPSLFLFGSAGFLCGLSVNFTILLILRTLQGLGAAALGSVNTTIIGDLYSREERIAAMGYNSSVLSVGTAGYPVIGGALALLGWNYPFFLPVLAIPFGGLVFYKLKNPEPAQQAGLKEYLLRTFSRLANRNILLLFFISAITFIILYGSYLTFFPLLISSRFGKSTLIIGLIMSAMSLTTAVTASRLGPLGKKYGAKKLIIIAFLFYIISCSAIPLMPVIWLLVPAVMLFGLAQGLNIPTVQSAMAGLAPLEHRAAFMSINGMVLRVGQTLGPLIMGLVFSVSGLNSAFFAGAGLALFTAVVSYFLLDI